MTIGDHSLPRGVFVIVFQDPKAIQKRLKRADGRISEYRIT
jgi:hypothetical protein